MIGDTGRYVNGFAFKPLHWGTHGKPIVRIQNLTDKSKPLNRTQIEVPRSIHVATGDLLVSWSATLDVFRWDREPALLNQHIFRVIPDTLIANDRWLYYAFKVAIRQLGESAHAHGSTMTHINRLPFLAHRLPLPPMSEQLRIADRLDEVVSDFDSGVHELLTAQKKLKQYRQSLLKSAVDGSLTAQWRAQNPPTESGADLLARILRERRAQWEAAQLAKFNLASKPPPTDWQASYREPSGPSTHESTPLPVGWIWASAGQLLASLTSGSRDWAQFYGRGDCTFVMAQNVRPWRPDFTFRQAVDPPQGDRDRLRSEIKVNDLLVTIVGANTGQSCRVVGTLTSHFVCQSVALLRLVETDSSEFMNAVLNSPAHGQRHFSAMNYGAGRPHLSFEQLEMLLVPLPPLDEQQQIITLLNDQLESLTAQEAAIQQALKLAAAQRQNILRAAFSGQLVPQDPNDEPASVLLARILAERDRQSDKPTAPKARRKKVSSP